MDRLEFPHTVNHLAVLDCLVGDASGVAPLFRDVVARTGSRPPVPDLFFLLSEMAGRGLLDESLPKGDPRSEVIARYNSWLPSAPLSELKADFVGAVYTVTDLGLREWERWRASFD